MCVHLRLILSIIFFLLPSLTLANLRKIVVTPENQKEYGITFSIQSEKIGEERSNIKLIVEKSGGLEKLFGVNLVLSDSNLPISATNTTITNTTITNTTITNATITNLDNILVSTPLRFCEDTACSEKSQGIILSGSNTTSFIIKNDQIEKVQLIFRTGTGLNELQFIINLSTYLQHEKGKED